MTDPTADDAKLLPCPFPWRSDDGTSKQCIERGHCGCDENTRPQPAPLDVVLHCPHCKAQHVDKADPANDWINPPHKSHLCHACGAIWRVGRPADERSGPLLL